MKFASIISAEPGWKAVLVKHPNIPVFIDVHYWGVDLSSKLHALDNTRNPFSEKPNFVAIIDNEPNEEETISIKVRCEYVAEKLWKQ